MSKKECPNGHWYDPSIYGDQCPMCPQPGVAPMPGMAHSNNFAGGSGLETHIGGPAPGFDNKTHVAGGFGMGAPSQNMPGIGVQPQDTPQTTANSGPTKVRPQEAEPQASAPSHDSSPHTVIRRPGAAAPGAQSSNGRKLVGFLVTYNRDPMGRAYNLYEGRNYVGRDRSCDISVPDDPQMSGKHMSILYRSVDNKFKFRDEQSSNGTFVNKELLDDGTLENYDVIRVGSTLFIFIAIPTLN